MYAGAILVIENEKYSAIGDDFVFENPLINSSSDIKHIGIAIPISLTNVSSLNKTTSRQFYVQGVKWSIQAEKFVEKSSTTFLVYLVADDYDLSYGMSLAAKINFKILPVIASTGAIVQNQQYHCYWGASKLKLLRIVSSNFQDSYAAYLHKDSMNFLINFKVEQDSIWDIEN